MLRLMATRRNVLTTAFRTVTMRLPQVTRAMHSAPPSKSTTMIIARSTRFYATPSQPPVVKPPAPKGNNVAVKKSLWQRVKDEAVHYWHGSKLLATEVKISTLLLLKMSRGIQLTRRENRQLVRTSRDMVKLIPFAIFVLVPFMELLLPLALRLFPGMLPSTFDQDKSGAKDELNRRQSFAEKVKVAKTLRDSIARGINEQDVAESKAEDFAKFFKKYRSSGEKAPTQEILDMCKRISDDITIDNLSRPQLITLSRFINLNPTSNALRALNIIGSDNFIRAALRRKMAEINRDDSMI